MAKLYTKKKNSAPPMLPKKETIRFIMNYSKALKVVKVGNTNQELLMN